MVRKFTLPLLLVGFLWLVGCSPKSTPTPLPLTPTLQPSKTPTITPTALPTELTAWLDDSIDPDQFGEDENIIIHFSQAMDPKSASAPLVFIPRILGEFTWNEAYTTLTFIPTSHMNPNITYEVSIARRLTNAVGEALPFRSSWFFIREVSPKIVSRQPAGTELPNRTRTMTFIFSHDMDQDSVYQAFTVEPKVPYTFAWGEKTLDISLDTVFEPGQEFHFTLGEGMRTQEGEPVQGVEWTYQAPLLRVEFMRIAGQSRVSPFTLEFNYPVDPKIIESHLSVSPTFPYETEWDMAKQTLTLNPAEPLVDLTLYTFSLGNEATIPQGFIEPQIWTYTAPALIVNFEVTDHVDRRPTFSFITSVPLDPESVASALRFEPAFDYTLTWNKENFGFEITPNTPLPSLTKYTARFVGEVLDAGGFPLSGLGVHRFTTPSPIANEPEFGSSEWNYNYYGPRPIAVDAEFFVLFDRPMEPESTLAALTISPTIPGEAVWIAPNKLQIIPSAGHLEPLTEYTLTLAPSSLDAEGHPVLIESYTWKVPTSDFPSKASFGEYGANVQVVDLDGKRALQIGVVGGLETVHLELYRITVEQFIEFDANTFLVPWGSNRAKPPFDLSGASLTASWDSEVVYSMGESYQNKAAEIYLPEDLAEGLYVINLHTDHLDDQMLLVASRSTIALQYNYAPEAELVAWISNINGHVMPNVDVRVYNDAGEQIASGVTDAIGIFKATLAEGETPHLVVARRDGGITVAGVGGVWGSRGYGGVRHQSADVYHAYLYTERPIYRPGQTVNYKGIVRVDNDVNFRLPSTELIATLKVHDSRNNVIVTSPITFNEFGTFHSSFDIAPGAMLGDYQLELVIGEESHYQTFKVQDYKKPDISVTVTADRAEYVAGDTMSITVDTRYLFGEPVANASLTVKTYELMPFYCCMWYEYPNGGSGEYRWFPSGKEMSFTADENGLATFAFPATIGQRTQNYYYDEDNMPKTTLWGIEVAADDGSNQEISSFTTVLVHSTAADAQLKLDDWLYAPNIPISITAIVSSVFGDPIKERILTLTVEKRTENYWSYQQVQTHNLETDENGMAQNTLTLEGGAYKLILTGKDSLGNDLRSTRYIYIHDSASSWVLDQYSDINLSIEDRDFVVGETAQVIVETTISGQGLLSIARGGVLEQRVIQLEAPITVLNIPIRAGFAPNVFAVVQAWTPVATDFVQSEWAYQSIADSNMRWGAVEIRVPDTEHRLTVEITSNKSEYAPREEATFTLRVTDINGNPARAELSLALVDEAIFLLADDPAGDIHQAFYTPRALSMFYSDSMAPWRYLWFEEGGMGGGGGDGSPGSPRTDFPDTALWLPNVVTNANGEATVTVTLPDSITSWRLTAKAVTQDTLIGEGQINILTQQPIVVRPLPPRNLTAGDTFVLSALVHNFSNESLELTVTTTAEGIEIKDELAQRLALASGESRVVNWAGTASQSGDATFTVIATSPDGRGDAIQMHIPIQPLMVPVFRNESGQFTGIERVSVVTEPGALPESGVHVQVDATVVGSVLNGVEYLTGYPYGCVEQTMSRALPNAVVARAFEQLGLSERADLLGLDSKLAASVQRLYAFQHDDGGWGWWFDDPSDGYQTAWVVFGLSITAESGYPVDAWVIERGADYLKDHLDELNPPTRAFAVYALAISGHGDLEMTLAQTAHIHELDLFSRASLALALAELGETTIANEMLDAILSEMLVAPNGNVSASGFGGDGYYDRKFMSSSVRTTAMVLRAVMALRPDSDLRPGMVQWLQSRRSSHGWGTTNETAFTLLALTDHLLVQQDEVADATILVYLNDTLLVTGTLSAGNLFINVDIPVADLADGENEIRLETDAIFPLYYSVNTEMFVGQTEIKGDGIAISRTYLDPTTKQPITTVQEGDLVLVRLTVDLPEDAFYLMLTDHLPGGLEALNEGLNTTGHDTAITERQYWDYEWDWFLYDDYGYNNKEIWPDRVLFFITEMLEGEYVFEYYARATVSGEFTALPAEIEAMYDATFWGRSASEVFQVIATTGQGATIHLQEVLVQ